MGAGATWRSRLAGRLDSHQRGEQDSSRAGDDSFFRSRLSAIESIGQLFALGLARVLSDELHARIEGRALPAFQLPYHEFRLTVSSPTFLAVFGAREFQGQLCLEITPRLGYLLIEKMLGGGDGEPLAPKRSFTPIELRLIQRLIERALEQLSAAFAEHAAATLYLQQTTSDPGSVHIVPEDEWVGVVPVEIYCGRHGGRMTVCVPQCAMERIAGAPTAAAAAAADEDKGPQTLTALLSETTLKLSELMTLQPGDIITTDLPTTSDVMLVGEDGRAVLAGQLVKFRGHRALAVTRRV